MEDKIVKAFFEYVNQWIDVYEDEKAFIETNLKIHSLKKDDFLLKEGDVAKELFFLTSGLVRSFYNKEGKELNTEFFFENNFLTAYTSFLTNEKTMLNFQCLEEAVLISIPKQVLEDLYKLDNKWYCLTKNIFEIEFMKKCRRESSFLMQDSSQRYLCFLSQFPNVEPRIPLFHIASYLGINPETLSRIRTKKITAIDVSQVDKI